VITGKHPASARAIRAEVPGAAHTQRGPHRASGPDTTPVERSHLPTQDRPQPLRGRRSRRTGRRAVEGVALARAGRRGDLAAPDTGAGRDAGPHARARAAATALTRRADGLRVAA
jgi:hypothetical protein